MPFSPLPATFLDDLRRLAPAGVLELGSGDGRLTALLRATGARPWTLDRAGPLAGARPHVRADALQPPLRGRFGLVVAGNLVRHLWPRIRDAGPTTWRGLVAPGGALWILEDEPMLEPAPAAHYARLQELLARLQPGQHGPLLPRRRFAHASARWTWPGRWELGEQANTWPQDRDRVVAWLGSGDPAAGGEVARLQDAIARDGLACGRMWWARWTPEEAR